MVRGHGISVNSFYPNSQAPRQQQRTKDRLGYKEGRQIKCNKLWLPANYVQVPVYKFRAIGRTAPFGHSCLKPWSHSHHPVLLMPLNQPISITGRLSLPEIRNSPPSHLPHCYSFPSHCTLCPKWSPSLHPCPCSGDSLHTSQRDPVSTQGYSSSPSL